MKKWTALLLCGILTLSLGGCAESVRSLGGKTTETEVYINADESAAPDESRVPDEKVAEEARADQSAAGGAGADMSGAAKDQTVADEAAKDQSVAEEAAKEQSGDKKDANKAGSASESAGTGAETEKMIQKIYLQEHFGYRLVLDEDWEFATDEELEEVNKQTAEAAGSDATFAKIVNAGNIMTDMIADDTVTGNSIVIKLIQIGLADVIGKEEDRNAVLADALYAEAEAAGLTNLSKMETAVRFLGETVTAIGGKGDLALSDEYTTEMWYQMISKQKGQYASVIFVTGFSEFGGDNFQEILDKFETLE